METDYTGAKSVSQIIEHTGLHHFIISRIASTRNSAPVYEFLTGSSNTKALEAFNKWASITENTNLYEMLLFNELTTDGEDAEQEKKGHNRNKSKSLKFTFTLTKQIPYNQQQQQGQQVDIAQAIENALMKQAQQNEEKESNRKILALEAKIDALISSQNDDDDDDDDDSEALSGLNNPNIVNLIGLLTKLTGQKTATPPAINGVKLSEEKIKNINIAVKKLAKYDDDIDTDLLKLAEIAENNNATFKMLLNSLRTM